MDRWYRQAVIVIWPGTRTFEILAGEGQASAIPELERRLAHSKKPAALANCRTFAQEIIAHWEPRHRSKEGEPPYPERMLKLIERLGDAKLAERFLRDVFPKDYGGFEGKVLLKVCERFGGKHSRLASRLFASAKPERLFHQTSGDRVDLRGALLRTARVDGRAPCGLQVGC